MKTVTSTQTTQGAPRSELVDTLFEVGTDWARQGIGIGIAAVRTQAGLFRTLSTTLDRAADAIAASAKPITDAPDATPAAKAAAAGPTPRLAWAFPPAASPRTDRRRIPRRRHSQ